MTIVTIKPSSVIDMKQTEHPDKEAKPPITSLHLDDSIKKEQSVYSLLTPIPCWTGAAWSEHKGLMTELSVHVGLCCTVSSAVLLRHVSTQVTKCTWGRGTRPLKVLTHMLAAG